MLTFEGAPTLGADSIIEKLSSLPFSKVKHQVTTFDVQPVSFSNGMIVMVTGALLVDDETMPQNYSQVFHLVPDNGSFYVFNDVFRLNLG